MPRVWMNKTEYKNFVGKTFAKVFPTPFSKSFNAQKFSFLRGFYYLFLKIYKMDFELKSFEER